MVISFKSKGSCGRALVSVEIDDISYLFFSFSLLTYKKELFCQWQLSCKDGGNTKFLLICLINKRAIGPRIRLSSYTMPRVVILQYGNC